MSSLIAFATQRSGRTLLCELLKATGVAGIPNEYFQHFKDTGLADQPRQYLAGISELEGLALLAPLDPGGGRDRDPIEVSARRRLEAIA
jgi:LPS sulfotransferase NodH